MENMKNMEITENPGRLWQVVSTDTKYYVTDGYDEQIVDDNIASKEKADQICKSRREHATPSPWTGFYVREKTRTEWYIEVGYGFADMYGYTVRKWEEVVRARRRDDFRSCTEKVYGMDGRLIKSYNI